MAPHQIQAYWTAIRSLAPDRLDSYRRSNDTDELDAVARYVWNVDVSKELHPKLHVLEVVFRNQLHNALTGLYGSNWFDRPNLLRPNSLAKVADAKAELTKNNKPLSPGRIVANLSFGFWTALYGPAYDPSIGRRTIKQVFPNYSGTARLERSVIAPLLKDARHLRNRVSHFEHVAFDPQLPRLHRQLCELIEWMNPEFAELSDVGDDLLSVYGKTWVAYRPIIEALVPEIEMQCTTLRT